MSLPTTNLTAHFDASATTNLFKTLGSPNISNSTGTPADGDAVEAWQKESDSGNDVGFIWPVSNTQAPNFRSGGSALMLHSCLDFDGTTDKLQCFTNAISTKVMSGIASLAAHTILIAIYPEVISSTGHGENTGHMILGDDTNGYYGLNLYDSSGTKKAYGYIYDGSDNFVEVACTAAASHVLMWRHTGGTQYISVDGGTEVSGAAGTIGSDTKMDLCGGGSAFYNGRIGEIAIYSDGTAGGSLATAISYFTAKWLGSAAVVVPFNLFQHST